MFSKLQPLFEFRNFARVALEVVAEEQVFEAIDRIPVVPIAPAPRRGWVWWYIGAAFTVDNMIVNDRPVFLTDILLKVALHTKTLTQLT
jgi:hypothetical protein